MRHDVNIRRAVARREQLDSLDFEYENCLLGNSRQFKIATTEVRTGSKATRPTDVHPLHSVAKAGDKIAVSYRVHDLLVFGEDVALIKSD
jgi:hypothetical protein